MKALMSITNSRLSMFPDTPTLKKLDPDLDISLWNGLFVRKGTSDDVRQKIIVARKTVMSDRAQKLASNTGTEVYWQDSDKSAARIVDSINTLDEIESILQQPVQPICSSR